MSPALFLISPCALFLALPEMAARPDTGDVVKVEFRAAEDAAATVAAAAAQAATAPAATAPAAASSVKPAAPAEHAPSGTSAASGQAQGDAPGQAPAAGAAELGQALLQAAHAGDVKRCASLLDRGADAGARDNGG